MTVWDTSTLYGDWTDEGETPSYFATPNGEVVIRITLVNVGTNGYTCKIRYALKGMQEGYGIEGRSEIYDASNTTLSSPKKSGYGIGLSMAEGLTQALKGKISVAWKDGVIGFTVLL